MSIAAVSIQTREKPRSRQKQGPACVECRRRKLRCDGQQPKCSTCLDMGIDCEQTSFMTPRGPKKGHMKALQSRIANLEARLNDQENDTSQITPAENGCSNIHMPSEVSASQNIQLPVTPPDTDNGHAFFASDMNVDLNMGMLQPVDLIGQQLQYDFEPDIPEVVRADLDQLFFERVHSFVPILQRRRYFSWSKRAVKTSAQKCLQYAVWLLASTFSAQSEHLRVQLRAAAMGILTRAESEDVDSYLISIEHAQARIMLLIHDLLKSSFDLVWRDAATTFRLFQYMQLYNMDSPTQIKKRLKGLQQEDEIYIEELRRTFWIAYTVDCFVSIRSGRPPTFHESAMAVRLPSPEEHFQVGRICRQNTLSEAMNSSTNHGLSTFSESIIIATICNRAVSHGQQASAESASSHTDSQIWGRHFWIEESLLTRSPALSLESMQNIMEPDGLLVFSRMASQCIMLYLYQILETKSWIKPEDKDTIVLIKERVMLAANEIAFISGSLARMSLFKIHPFTPLLLGFCTDFLADRHADFGLDATSLQNMNGLLAAMSSVNTLASHALNSSSMSTFISVS